MNFAPALVIDHGRSRRGRSSLLEVLAPNALPSVTGISMLIVKNWSIVQGSLNDRGQGKSTLSEMTLSTSRDRGSLNPSRFGGYARTGNTEGPASPKSRGRRLTSENESGSDHGRETSKRKRSSYAVALDQGKGNAHARWRAKIKRLSSAEVQGPESGSGLGTGIIGKKISTSGSDEMNARETGQEQGNRTADTTRKKSSSGGTKEREKGHE